MTSQIKVLTKLDKIKSDSAVDASDEDLESIHLDSSSHSNIELGAYELKHESEARAFKLIDDKEWNIISSEPASERNFFSEGHSAMSIISAIGPKGCGKSTLLNKIARTDAFKTYTSTSKTTDAARINVKHVTRGIDIHSTHHRLLLDCQPLLATSVLEDFLTGQSSSQFSKGSLIADPLTSCHMISLQLATFIIATSDYVIIMSKWLIDIHMLKLISSAIMMIGEDNLRAKFIMFSNDKRVNDDKFKAMVERGLGKSRIERFFDKEDELLDYIAPYNIEKCDLNQKDPSTFTGKNWLASCQRLWNTTIRNSSMFSDYALQLFNENSMTVQS